MPVVLLASSRHHCSAQEESFCFQGHGTALRLQQSLRQNAEVEQDRAGAAGMQAGLTSAGLPGDRARLQSLPAATAHGTAW